MQVPLWRWSHLSSLDLFDCGFPMCGRPVLKRCVETGIGQPCEDDLPNPDCSCRDDPALLRLLMRSPLDRLRHTLSFEIVALVIIIPLGSAVFHLPSGDVGVVGIVSATLATLWNYAYNVAFDVALQRLCGTTLKSLGLRVLHALLFELGLLVVLIPFIAWYLAVPLVEAFLMDAALTVFYVVYGFSFNWAYDRLFPLAEWDLPPNESKTPN